MEHRNGRDGRDALSAQLSQLLSRSGVDVHESVHVADAELRYAVLRILLPLRFQSRGKNVSLIWKRPIESRLPVRTYIVTQRPVWLLCEITCAGFISSSPMSCPAFQSPTPLKLYTFKVSS